MKSVRPDRSTNRTVELELPAEMALAVAFPLCWGIDPKSCYYLSAPISSGRVDVPSEWNDCRPEEQQQLRDTTKMRNIQRVESLVNQLRPKLKRPLIDPTLLEIPDWQQSDYHQFWLAIIREWCDTIILAEGWQYSTGCCMEVALAIRSGLPLLRENLTEMSKHEVASLVIGVGDAWRNGPWSSDMYRLAAQDLLGLLGVEE